MVGLKYTFINSAQNLRKQQKLLDTSFRNSSILWKKTNKKQTNKQTKNKKKKEQTKQTTNIFVENTISELQNGLRSLMRLGHQITTSKGDIFSASKCFTHLEKTKQNNNNNQRKKEAMTLCLPHPTWFYTIKLNSEEDLMWLLHSDFEYIYG